MKLIIQKTSEPNSVIPDTEIRDINELLLGLDSESGKDIVSDEEEDLEEETEFQAETESQFEDMVVDENENEYIIELNIPGFRKEDFIIEVREDGILSVNAMAETESYGEENSVQSQEISENVFSRSFRLPEDANLDEIEAWYENGILALCISKD